MVVAGAAEQPELVAIEYGTCAWNRGPVATEDGTFAWNRGPGGAAHPVLDDRPAAGKSP